VPTPHGRYIKTADLLEQRIIASPDSSQPIKVIEEMCAPTPAHQP
jgi:hypothetical protein